MSFRIEARKKDERLHYHWYPQKIFESQTTLAFYNKAPRQVVHHTHHQRYVFDTHGLEIFWKDAPFSLGLAVREGSTPAVAYYCNIHEPFVRVHKNRIHFIDLDLDVIKALKKEKTEIVDWDEFEKHATEYHYPEIYRSSVPNIARKIKKKLDEEFSAVFFLKYFEDVKTISNMDAWMEKITEKFDLDSLPSLLGL